VDGTKYDLSPDAWTMVAFNASSALLVPPFGSRIFGQVAPEDETPDAGGFAIRGMRLIRGLAPFEALWLRADTALVTVTVYQGNSMSSVVYFGKSPFRLRAPGPVEIEVPYVPQVLDGGAPDTDFAGLAVIDCGGATTAPTIRTIDALQRFDIIRLRSRVVGVRADLIANSNGPVPRHSYEHLLGGFRVDDFFHGLM
jgi:hypothetical protein